MRHLPSLFVILLSAATATLAVLFWQAQREHAELEAHNASLLSDIEQQVVFMQGQTEALRREMLLEIQDEIHNQGKHDNVGLADTLEMLGEGTAYLLAQTPLDAQDWEGRLHSLQAICQYHHHPRFDPAPPVFAAERPRHAVQQQLRLLQWERATLAWLNLRLGTTKCYFGNRPNLLVVSTDTPTVRMGTPFEADLWLYWDRQEFFRQPKQFFHTSMGTISHEAGPVPRLRIATDGLLAPGQNERFVPFTIEAKAVSPIGGYEWVEQQQVMRVVRE